MKALLCVLIGLTCVTTAALADEPIVFWADSAGGSRSDIPYDIAVDRNDNLLVTGRIWGRAEFDDTTSLVSTGTNDVFVTKYSPEGTILWARKAGGPHTYTYEVGTGDHTDGEHGSAVASDNSGNVLVAGQVWGTADFSGISVSSPTGRSRVPFVAKYDAAGTPIWVHTHDYRGTATGVGTDSRGNVFFGGTIWPVCDPPERDGSRSCYFDGILAKLDPSGREVWRRQIGGTGHQQVTGLAVDSAGNIAIVGYFNTVAQLDDVTALTTDRSGFFLAKYAPDGRVLWATRPEGSSALQYARAVAFDEAGNVIVTGAFNGTLTFARGRRLTSSGGSDVFVAKYDRAGSFLWAQRAGSTVELPRVTLTDEGKTLAVDGLGDVFVGGTFTGNASFGANRLNAEGPEDGFVAKYSHDGTPLWATRLGGPSYVETNGVAVSNGGRLFATGYFAEELRVGEITLRSAGIGDIFVLELGFLPGSDSGEIVEAGVGSWDHIHARCPALVRRALRDPEATCPGVFENGFAPRGAEEIWTLAIDNRTLNTLDDVDHYHIRLPDPGSAVYPGHDDIRPSAGPWREAAPERMPECGFLRREELGPDGRDRTTNVSLVGRLTIEVVPVRNSLTDRPVATGGEGIKLYPRRRAR